MKRIKQAGIAGVDSGAWDQGGLHAAAKDGDAEAVAALLAGGTDHGALDDSGRTPSI